MKARNHNGNTPTLRTVIILALRLSGVTILAVVLVIGYYISIKPIRPSTYYYKDIFGNIYYNSTGGCFDVCLLQTYTPLSGVARLSFTILTVESPYFFVKEKVESEYAKDIFRVYYRDRIVNTTDPQSFEALAVHLGKDNLNYYLNGMQLPDYITTEFNPSFTIDSSSLTVLSYKLNEYVIIKHRDDYYYLKLNPQPMEMRLITASEANQYPPLTGTLK